jgi:[protein-PII] uridylyltransferase
LSEREFQSTKEAVAFIRNVRNLLHYVTNRKCDQLYLEHQTRLADLMKLSKKDGQEPVERFLGTLHGKMEHLKQQHQIFFSELGYIKPMKQGRRILGKRTKIKGLVVDKKNMLNFTSVKAVLGCPELLIKIFRESIHLATPLSAAAKRIVKDSLYLVDENFKTNPRVVKIFEDIVTAPPATGIVLDEMLATGFLVQFIPEMKGIVNRIQYNEYHIFPVDKHSIRTVQMAKNFSASNDSDTFYYDVYNDLSDKKLLLWTCLLHDIGKSEPSENHTESGARIAGNILKSKGYNQEDIETVQFLIKEHLFLIQIATRRDIHEEGTAIFCARKIKDVERLNMLYLLTVADSMSTGPKAWNDWSSTLLRELYSKIRNILKKVELASSESVELADKKKHDIRSYLSDRKEKTDIDSMLDILSPRYLLYVSTKDILEHIDLFDRLTDSEFVWEVKKDAASNTRIISVCAKNKPGLFSKIAGVLTLSNIDILNAQVYTWKNNIALDIFHVTPPKDQIFEEDIWKRVGKKLTETICYDVNLPVRLKQKILETKPGKLHTLKRDHTVTIDNESSDFFTIIEVCAYDYPGLLFNITDTLYRIGLDIYVAKIATKVDQVMDIFYVRNLYSEKADSKEQVEEIESAIQSVLPTTGSSPFHIVPSDNSHSRSNAFQ